MILEAISQAIEDSGKSRNRISQETGIDPTILWRVTHGRTCSLGTLDRLCVYLGLELRPQRRKGKVTRGKRG
jgi:ribosome-binding protein aMBF1 (putative translation factor)